jgi:hypothetical protein
MTMSTTIKTQNGTKSYLSRNKVFAAKRSTAMSSRERLWHVMEMTSNRRGTQSPALNISPPAHPVAADSKKETGESRWDRLTTSVIRFHQLAV